MAVTPCKCGAGCDDYETGGCDGEVVAISDSPPLHRCAAHCYRLGLPMSITVAPEAMDLFAPPPSEAKGEG